MLTAYTLYYVKPIQLYYQLFYRIKNIFLKLRWYTDYDNASIYKNKYYVHKLLTSGNSKYETGNRFFFLNLFYDFKETIDWNFSGHGKLWNYNLQYFDYLLDEKISTDKRFALISDFSHTLLTGKIKPEPYPVSLRIINTLIFISENNISNNSIIVKALKRQINFLERNLEYHLLANHLLENIFTLFISAFALNNKHLHKKTFEHLQKELNDQILPDGAHYECSPTYHNIILGKLLLCIDVANQNKVFEANILPLKQKASKMLAWINAFSFRNGTWSLMNDAASDIAPTLQQLNETAAFLNIVPDSCLLKDSGYRKMTTTDIELLIDVANIIPSYQPGHAHSDMLSFTLNYKGHPVFVDTGTSTYENNSTRHFERSTIAHNTVVVNNINQSQVWGSFRVAKRAKIKISDEDKNFIKAFHDGYYKNFGVIHSRQFSISNSESLHITDEILRKKNISTTAVAHFHLDASISIEEVNGNNIQLSNGLRVHFQDAENILIEDFQQAMGFNKLINSKKIAVFFSNKLFTQISIA